MCLCINVEFRCEWKSKQTPKNRDSQKCWRQSKINKTTATPTMTPTKVFESMKSRPVTKDSLISTPISPSANSMMKPKNIYIKNEKWYVLRATPVAIINNNFAHIWWLVHLFCFLFFFAFSSCWWARIAWSIFLAWLFVYVIPFEWRNFCMRCESVFVPHWPNQRYK